MKRMFSFFFAILLGSALLSGCESSSSEEEVILGTSMPLTGIFENFGEGSKFGMEAAIEDINAEGGLDVGGKKMMVRLLVRDNESDAIKSGRDAEDLIVNEKVNALVSPTAPPSLQINVSVTAEVNKIPLIIGGGPFEPWDEKRRIADPPWQYSWLLGFAIAVEPTAEGDFRSGQGGYTIRNTWLQMLNEYGAQTNKVAGVFATNDDDGTAWYKLFPGLLKEEGYTVIDENNLGLVAMDTNDYTELVQTWMDEGVELIWGNSPSPHFQAMWATAREMGFEPKIVSIGRAALFPSDIAGWEGDLPRGVGLEVWWSPEYPEEACPGIGDRTPQSLANKWKDEKQTPVNPAISSGYVAVQVMLDAISRAGSLDPDKINTAIKKTDMQTITHRVKFDTDEHLSRKPLFFGQWVKNDNNPDIWEMHVVFSQHDWLKNESSPFLIPYEE